MATNWNCTSSIQIVIRDLNEIAADAYRHRIRPTLKKGGNGVYDRSNGGFEYRLPEKLSVNRRARFEVVRLTANILEIRATSLDDSACFISAIVNSRGGLGEIMLPENGQSWEAPRPREPQGHALQVYQTPAIGRAVLFFEEQ